MISFVQSLVLFLIALVLSAGTWQRATLYGTGATLWEDTAQGSPRKARPHNNYGHELKNIGRYDEAQRQFEWALSIDPDYADALNNLATIYGGQGRYADARLMLQRVLMIQPGHIQAKSNLAMHYYEAGQLDDSLREYREIIMIRPASSEAAFAYSMIALIQKQRSGK